ncbi:MAG: protein-L-isoaspartate O-methyltransferase [Candidatus Nealsonbacteria bacterium CG02_land_8_20_14_3_00_37_10]|uniref:Protein-L-isoaspartate O-methyltransferase n=2 Tax=Candidatus Nealsoniibacteriota TaxID=1817911 RepID=A0A2G9YYD4_9BACT|nr:MAG: protein-L-isoaspartate O-methyltransferase [Candidatus Nealsonbacteria bacterium CG23_combo_of_CG06-09_8_20_14_all_37_18]PIV45187.1 MAG: protein-L-isoaspartate O-methyltransferase [Candidatus Nealsonbacteria bacterium CG02_land_8_20_14_3_00_37_10]
MALVEELIKEGYLKTPGIIEAFKKIKRVDFLPQDLKDLAELNEALPIGYGQTISQPLVVAFMLELLEPKEGEKILDIGSGSGWTSALLGEIVGEKGKVVAIEVVPELKEFGEKNNSKYNFIEKGRVQFICVDGSKGYEKEAPFDKILVSATAIKIPDPWKKQLKIGGRIVTPIDSSIFLFTKKSEKEFEQIEYPGFVFVPLIEK